ncbi:hypothetical protein LTR56_015997 [Elasticomyces elasticus]|nr:hypothetical protein LTR22_025202 [Elasticomyces elasticus]KAK3633083.1 hypothetical protein LTR56_015997 [Elasticomyces elasticus]KAK4917925.1 hypothetical protein LTR49_014200 [Elasticomyces elasticus]KAK5753321.1 hypothetical protein LTS12_016564 [Elasticomyces elasticus]
MDVFHIYSLASAGYLAVQAVPLLLVPKVIVSILTSEPRRITDAETYLARSHALLLLAFAILNLLLSGIIPLANSWDDSAGEGLAKNPYSFPTLVVTTTYHALTAFYIYTQLTPGWSFALGAGLMFSSLLFCVGMWVIVFGSEKGRLSKTTGADKRTAGFPFANSESAKEIKKELKEKEKEREKSARESSKSSSSDKEKDKDKDRSKRRSVARALSSRA